MAKSKKSSTSSHSKSKKVEAINPFEVKTNRQKHTILGRKTTKHEVGKPFQSRKKAVEKRKKTLLVEYSNLGKVNSIVDRRTGEYDKSLSADQKKLKRLARVRKFNLADSDEEEFGPEETLTHFGQSLADADGNWNDNDSDDDDEDDGRLAGDIVAMEHFSGGGGGLDKEREGEERRMTHQDRLKEQIQKKNLEKFNRDKQKEELQTQRVEIDSQFTEYMSLLKKFQEGAKERSEKEEEERGKTSSFSMTRKSLLFERRGTPAERLKTPEQLAKEENERLEKLEAERLQRMIGSKSAEVTLSADALTTNMTEALDVFSRRGRKRLRNSKELDSGDEDEEKEQDDEDDKESEDDENEDGSDDDDDDDDEDEENDDLDSDDEEENEDSVADEEDNPKETDNKNTDSKEEESQFETKLSTYCEMLANSSNLQTLQTIDEMTEELVNVAQRSASAAGQTMIEMIERLCSITQKSMPGLETLLFLRLSGLVFPPSDRRHPVTTPAMLLMSKLLNHFIRDVEKAFEIKYRGEKINGSVALLGVIRNCRDVASGLFLSTLFLEFVSLSRRFVPEIINFLSGVLFLAASKPSDKEHFVSLQFKSGGNCNPMKLINKVKSSSTEVGLPLNIHRIYTDQKFMESDDLRIQCLVVCLELVKRFRSLYSSLPAVEAIFLPIKCLVEALHLGHHPHGVQVICNEVAKTLSEKATYCPLVKMPKRPVPMKQLEPKVDEKFDGRKKLVGSREWKLNKIEVQKSKKLKKDAERELRKDHRVLQAHIIQQSLKKKKIKDQKVKDIMSSLATQEGEWRSLKKGKNTEERGKK